VPEYDLTTTGLAGRLGAQLLDEHGDEDGGQHAAENELVEDERQRVGRL
jgi:hypothetical protein